MAAVTNIANGSGSALDGAKVLRARPDLMDGSVPLSAGKGEQAAALARLDDEAFRMVVNEVVPEHFGAVVGQVIPADGARQVAALKAIARFEPRSVEEATALTQRVSSAELARAEEGRQASLFGDLDAPESTAGEEMRIVARVIRDLRRDRGLFSRVVANASRLEASRLDHRARRRAIGRDGCRRLRQGAILRRLHGGPDPHRPPRRCKGSPGMVEPRSATLPPGFTLPSGDRLKKMALIGLARASAMQHPKATRTAAPVDPTDATGTARERCRRCRRTGRSGTGDAAARPGAGQRCLDAGDRARWPAARAARR